MERMNFGKGSMMMGDKRAAGKGTMGDKAAGKMEEKKAGRGKEAVAVKETVKKPKK